MARKEARPVLIESDHEFIKANFNVPEHYQPEHTEAQIRRWEGIKEVMLLLREKFTSPLS